MNMTIDEILKLDDIGLKITYLKKGRKTEEPNKDELWKDWNPNLHEIMVDKEKYPNRKVLKKDGRSVFDEKSGKTYEIEPEYEEQEVNRIAIPIEQDIVNIQTAFTVGTEPTMECTPSNDGEEKLLGATKAVFRNNKIKFQNKRIVRSWLSEQEVAEYWYATDDNNFWKRFWNRIKSSFGGKVKPNKRLKSVIWSPFRGDSLFPFFNDKGDLVAFSREYKVKHTDGTEVTCFMTVTDKMVYQWNLVSEYKEITPFAHGFQKLPIIYAYRPEAYCKNIKTFRVRLEKLMSNYADCIDYHFFPLLKLIGEVEGFAGKTKDRIVKLTGEGADAQYLTWNQVPTTVELEMNTLFEKAYSMTNTPQISFEKLSGSGNALSGIAFDYVFLSTHLQVQNHAEVIGEFLQRRINFIVSALESINPSEFSGASSTIDIETNVVPYTLNNIDDKVSIAVKAVSGNVWSQRHGVMFAGNQDRVEEELAEINEERKQKMQEEMERMNSKNISNGK